jgi:phosphate-selective porin
VPAAEKPATQVDASKGGLTVRSGDNSLTFGAYVQVRATFDDRESYDADAKGTLGHGEADGVMPAFDVTRVRLSMKGTMFRPWVRYNVSLEAGRTAGESDNKLKDAYLELGDDRLAVRAGQYKVPFSLQMITGDSTQGFVDRAIATVQFGPDREAGAILTGTGKGKKLGWSVGAFNGSGESRRQNNEALMWSARAWVDPLGEYRLAEGAVDGPPASSVHLGLAVRGGDMMKGGRAGVVQHADDETAVGVELGWRRRRAYAIAEGYWQEVQVNNPTVGPDVESTGFLVQGGVIVLPPSLEVGLRWSQVDPNRDAASDHAREVRGAVNYYWKGHNLKLQADFGQLVYEPGAPGRASALRLPQAAEGPVTDWQGRMQLQLFF